MAFIFHIIFVPILVVYCNIFTNVEFFFFFKHTIHRTEMQWNTRTSIRLASKKSSRLFF